MSVTHRYEYTEDIQIIWFILAISNKILIYKLKKSVKRVVQRNSIETLEFVKYYSLTNGCYVCHSKIVLNYKLHLNSIVYTVDKI